MPKHGESIWKRKDGRWEARYIKYRKDDGHAVYASVYAKTYSEVKEKREKALSELKQQTKDNDVITFATVADEFFINHRMFIRDSTYARYMDMYGKHIRPYVGDKPVSVFSQETNHDFISFLLKKGKQDGSVLAPKTVRDIISLLKLILKYAQLKGYISGVPDFLSIPQTKKAICVFTPTQQKQLEEIVKTTKDSYKFGVYLCLYTGLRIGELCALQWKDVDHTESTISINKTILRIKNLSNNCPSKTQIVINPPKTPSGERVIPLPKILNDMLFELRERFCGKDSDYVLTGSEKYIEPRNYYERYKGYLSKCGLEGFSFHALRHTFASRCIETGMDPKVLSELLGHSSVRITLDLYVHPSFDIKRDGLSKLIERNGSMDIIV